MTAVSQPTRQINIVWPTNFNGKLSQQKFIHLDFAPKKPPLRADLHTISINIFVKDHSHQSVKVICEDIQVLCWSEVTEQMTRQSHGMSRNDYADYLFSKYDYQQLATISPALYYYCKA